MYFQRNLCYALAFIAAIITLYPHGAESTSTDSYPDQSFHIDYISEAATNILCKQYAYGTRKLCEAIQNLKRDSAEYTVAIPKVDSITVKEFVDGIIREAEEILDSWQFLKTR